MGPGFHRDCAFMSRTRPKSRSGPLSCYAAGLQRRLFRSSVLEGFLSRVLQKVPFRAPARAYILLSFTRCGFFESLMVWGFGGFGFELMQPRGAPGVLHGNKKGCVIAPIQETRTSIRDPNSNAENQARNPCPGQPNSARSLKR